MWDEKELKLKDFDSVEDELLSIIFVQIWLKLNIGYTRQGKGPLKVLNNKMMNTDSPQKSKQRSKVCCN